MPVSQNGAIIAANSDREDYPHEVQSYRYVWPRDAAYICRALEHLGLVQEQLNFFRWLKRTEDLAETGLLFQNYHTNGRKRWLAFQPDQNGLMLWAITEFMKAHPEHKAELLPLVTLMADGICGVWKEDHFTVVTQDLWEEFFTYPELRTTFTYSLAACSHGLDCAVAISKNSKWSEVSQQMKAKIDKSCVDGRFLRRSGIVNDFRPDISLLGLVWPFKIYAPDDPRIVSTVKQIQTFLEHNGGFYRYQYDDHDCFRFQGTNARRGAGTWPIASFWISICSSMRGDKKQAQKHIDSVVKRLDQNLSIPEQLFDNAIQVSVKPLAWSHAMYIMAQEFLTHP